MSGLVDIWTSELAKLREKGQTIWSSGSSPTPNNPPECSSKVGQAEGGSLLAMAEPLATWIKVMSGIVDTWTSELAKLREKGQPIWSGGSHPTAIFESNNAVQPTAVSSLGLFNAFGRVMRVKPLPCSDASSLTMLVEWFSP
ncbi:conserved hypothetical protein [Ricinus communis]|uniref:Uncharacterized protein n=1 Tax=Ricinus communis TaxID=3988 RepID=B9RZF7_RICCO|nr:conserved hypothetical protein [Ricinus communis]